MAKKKANPNQLVNDKLVELLNQQIQNEFKASAQYVAIAVHFDDASLPSLAKHFYKQAEEERVHAMKFVQYMLDAGAKPEIRGLPNLRNDFTSAADAVQCALDGELEVTRQINNLVDEAAKNKDHMTHTFLQWFVSEQVEEEATITAIIDQLKLVKDSQSGMFLMDKELGARTVAHPMP